MTYDEASITLFKFRSIGDNTGISHEQAAHAREVLQRAFSDHRGWKTVDAPNHSPERRNFLQEFLEARGNDPVAGFDLDWPECWVDSAGRAVAMTGHAYGLRADQIKRCVVFSEAYNLDLRVTSKGSWHNAGLIVIFERKLT